MFSIARRQLRQGLSVIYDSPLAYRGLYAQARALAAETGATLAVVECSCPDEAEWQRRIDRRKALGPWRRSLPRRLPGWSDWKKHARSLRLPSNDGPASCFALQRMQVTRSVSLVTLTSTPPLPNARPERYDSTAAGQNSPRQRRVPLRGRT